MPACRRVILLILDGLRPDAVTPSVMPHLTGMAERGWRAERASTVRPSVTVAALGSLGTGVPPAEHGLLDATLAPLVGWRRLRPLPLELRKAGIPTAISTLGMPGSHRLLARSLLGMAGVSRLLADAREPGEAADLLGDWLAGTSQGFGVAYLNGTDVAGHRDGWMSPGYLAEAAAADAAVAALESRMDQGTLLLVSADHGGGGVDPREHDHPHPLNDAIPIVIRGHGVRPGARGDSPASLLDLPPTILHRFRVPPPPGYRGRVLHEAFHQETIVSAA